MRANPVITRQPAAPSAVCEASGTQVMSVTATGYTLSYQWQENQGSGWNNVVNGGVYSGATTGSLTLTSPALVMNGYQYRVTVTGGCGSPLTSSVINITVNQRPIGVSTPSSQTVCSNVPITQIVLTTSNGRCCNKLLMDKR